MANKNLVAECVSKISANVKIPVTVKTRIGIDDNDSYEFLMEFIDKISGKYNKSIILFNFMANINQIDMLFSNYESDSHIEIKYFRKKHFCNSKNGNWFRVSNSGAKERTTNGYLETRKHENQLLL